MVKMHKLTKGGQTIFPATIYDAVVNPNSRKNLTTELSELGQEIKYELGEKMGESELLDITKIFTITDSMLLSNGNIKTNTNARVSEYIEIKTGAKIVGDGLLANNGTAAIAFYGEKYNVVGVISLYGTGEDSIEVNPDDYPEAKYYRVCCSTSFYNNTLANISSIEGIVSLTYKTPKSVVTKLDMLKKEMFEHKVLCHADCGSYVDRSTGKWADAGADSNGCLVQVMPNSIISVYPYRGNKKCSTFAFLTDDTKSNDSIVKVYYTDKAESLYDNITVPENANYIWVAVNPREESIIQRYIVKYDSTSIYDISKKIEDTKAELEESINNIEDTIGTNDKALYCVPIDSNHIENGYIRTDGTKAGSSGHSMAFYDILEKKRLLLHTVSTSAKEEKMAWWVLRDSLQNVIASAHFPYGTFANTIYDAIIDIPDNAVELVLNKTRTTDDYYVKEYIVNLVKEVADTKERISVIEDTFKHTPLLCGDSTGGAIGSWLKKYSRLNGVAIYGNNRGGEHTTAMGFYSGAIPAVVKPITIPSSGSIQIEIKSTLTNSAGNLTQLVAGQLEDIASADNLPRKGVNPITIHGVQGILSAGTSNVYGIHFYNASNKSVGGYNSSSYAQTIHPSFSDTPTKVRVCVNADSIEDLQNCSAHLTINNTIIELIPSIRNTGGLSPSGGTSTAYAHCMYSDYIDISQVGTINTIYIDGLAVPAEYTFTRLEDGDSVDVNEYDMVGIANHDFFKQCIPMYYVNNFAYTGREKAEDWVFVAKKLCEYHGDKFIFASTHFLFHSHTEDECSKIQNALASEFGERYFSGMAYLRDSGIRDAVRYGVYTSAEVNGKTWKELFLGSETTPDVHEKPEAGYLLARKFLEIGAHLGYWKLKDVDYAHLSAV